MSPIAPPIAASAVDQYRKLPFWDAGKEKLVSGRNVPQIQVVEPFLHSSPMTENSCHFWCPQQWYARLDDPMVVADGASLRFSVTYDSGGLFDTFGQQFEFKFHSHLHGE